MARLTKPLARVPRAFVPCVAAAIYGVAASLEAGGPRGLRTWILAAVAIGMAMRASWRITRPAASAAADRGVQRARDPLAPPGDRTIGFASWGVALVLASVSGAPAAGWGEAMGAVGALVAAVAAVRALENPSDRDAGATGLVASLPHPPRMAPVAQVLLVAAWGAAIVAHAGSAVDASWTAARHAADASTLAGSIAAMILLAACVWQALARRLELGAIEKLRAAGAALPIVLAVAVALALLRIVTPDRAARVGASAGALLVVHLSFARDAVRVARTSRLALVLAMAGGPLAIVIGLFTIDRPLDAPLLAGIGCVAALLLGAASRALSDPLRPAQGAWLDGIERAQASLFRGDPDEALAEVLVALRAPAGPTAPSPELWTFDPDRVLRIDAAGYPRERDEALVAGVLDTASHEPHAILRAEVMDALEVRRPDLRGVGRWMQDRDAFAAVVVTRGGEPEALLALPRGVRSEPLSLEEARALKELADRLAAACHVRSATARSRSRELALLADLEKAEDATARLQHDVAIDAARHARATSRLARPATVGIYSASARLAYDALERRAKAGAPLVVIAPSGIDPIPYLARAHLAGARANAPLVLVDGTAARDHDLARWTDPVSSPLALADGGMLVLADGAALPADVQRLVAQALAEKRPPWERAMPLDVVLALTAVDEEVLDSRLDPALLARLADAREHAVALPRLSERAEDVRAILADRLAREGLRTLGSPVGLEDAAYARLVEYPFPGDEAEVAALVQRLVARCAADGGRLVVRAADIEALDLQAPEEGDEAGKSAIRLV